MRLSFASIALVGLCIPICRYTVRDLGFVDMRGAEHVLRLHATVDAQRTAAEALAAFDPEATSNVRFEATTTTGAVRWSLLRAGRPELFLHVTGTDGGDLGADLGAWAALDRALGSKTLKRLSADTLDTFAFAVIVERGPLEGDAAEGSSERANGALHALVVEAEERLMSVADQLPRRIEWPLRTVVIESDAREAERVLLWALGLGPGELAPDAGALALVYGRGKLAGPVLSGDTLELREVLEQLVLIGESCECETQRAWTDEPRLPLRWADSQRAAAVAALGFDPDSPMVKGEVARILARGPRELEERPQAGIESLLFGYQETDLVRDALAAPRGGEVVASAASPDERRSAVSVVGAGDGDWAFVDGDGGLADGDGGLADSDGGFADDDAAPAPPGHDPGPGFAAAGSLLFLLGLAAVLLAVLIAVVAGLVLKRRGRER